MMPPTYIHRSSIPKNPGENGWTTLERYCAYGVRPYGVLERCNAPAVVRYLAWDTDRQVYFPLYVCSDHDRDILEEGL